MKRSARAFIVALLIGALLPGCGEAFVIGSGVGLAVGSGLGQPGEGLFWGATCGVVAEYLWVENSTQKDGDDYDDSFFFWPKSPKYDTACGGVIVCGVFVTAALLIEPENGEMGLIAANIGLCSLVAAIAWEAIFQGLAEGMRVMTVEYAQANTKTASRRTALLIGPTGVAIACRF